MKNKNKKKGFTLVELLAVITIIGIIMVISVPSVLSTVETARKKTFLEYVDKIFSAGKAKWLLYSSNPYPQPSELNYYLFDLKEDLGFDNLGDYIGIFMVMECDAETCAWANDEMLGGDLYMNEGDVRYIVALTDKNYSGAYDLNNKKRVIRDADTELYNMFKNSTKSQKEVYSFMQLLTKCNSQSQSSIDSKNNKIIQYNESHSSNWINHSCTNYTDEESLALFANFMMS